MLVPPCSLPSASLRQELATLASWPQLKPWGQLMPAGRNCLVLGLYLCAPAFWKDWETLRFSQPPPPPTKALQFKDEKSQPERTALLEAVVAAAGK